MVKVSIVVPNYNYARYLTERIQSLLNQTYQDIELIVVDDASTDHSIEIIEKYKNNPLVKTLYFSQNSGLPYKRWNDGAAMASGEYILFAGADDSCAPEMLERLVEKLDANQNVGIAYCQSMRMDSHGELVHSMKRYTNTLDRQRWNSDYIDSGKHECCYMVAKCTIPNSSAALIRRSIFDELGGFEESLHLVADWLLWSRILSISDIAFVAEPLNYFRFHPHTVRSRMYKVGAHTHETYTYISLMQKEAVVPAECIEKAYDRASYCWCNSILRLVVTHPAKALKQAQSIYQLASQYDPRLNARLRSRILKDVLSLGFFTLSNRLMWR